MNGRNATRSAESKMAWSVVRSPARASRATAVAVTGLSTPRETRRLNCPSRATGWSGVMLMLAVPMRNSAAQQFTVTAAAKISMADFEVCPRVAPAGGVEWLEE
ncbi:MAG: hypothetical protein BWX84_01770 [Verrucomicrobia bacterium ADurb.Bin118]|nr:MAG: hypothetical protein BWX84_01770 [Verrucomicrobia bacterium ADurb.Bin118]